MTGQALLSLLDSTRYQLLAGQPYVALRQFCESLLPTRLAYDDSEWTQQIKAICLDHPVKTLFHECPLTRRAYEKPRGYAGDAEMLDMIYYQCPPLPLTSQVDALFKAVGRFSTGSSVSLRRDIFACHIDEAASVTIMPTILSLACGHLREAERSLALRDHRIGQLVAVDQDKLSLDTVKRQYPDAEVVPCLASVKEIIGGQDLGLFDLIYSGGLYDYLVDSAASALTSRLFSMLKPGGQLLISNFTPDNYGRAYMEIFMDWHLALRTEHELISLINQVDLKLIDSATTCSDIYKNIAYLKLRRCN